MYTNKEMDSLQTKRELFIHMILEKICTCGDKDCPLLYDGYMSDIPDGKRPEFDRTCKNNKNIQYYVEDEIVVRKRDRGTIMAFKLDEVEFGNPEIETIIINKIKNFTNIA